jgi:8-oxo-dGTP pyrophosphatase MutT (NUDIX family)
LVQNCFDPDILKAARATFIAMKSIQTKTQISAGGVAFRNHGKQIQVALISVGKEARWQLPKGIIDNGESPEDAAQREVREEAGIETTLVEMIDRIEYWYVSTEHGSRVRYHKFVYFYLLKYERGDVRNHDNEVNEARWIAIDEAIDLLSFDSEKKVVEKARGMLAGLGLMD